MADLRHVKGLSQLNAMLQTLPAKMERNVLRGALRAGAAPVRQEAKAKVPVASGQLRDGIKISTSSKGGRVLAKIKLTGPHAFLGRWLEYGTAAHVITGGKGWLFFGGTFAKAVDHPGTAPRPFMRPALDNQAAAAVVATGNYIKKRLMTRHGLDQAGEIEIEAV